MLQMKKVSREGEPLRVEIRPMMLRHAAPDLGIVAELHGQEFRLYGEVVTVKSLVTEILKIQHGPVETKILFDSRIGSSTAVYGALRELIAEGNVIKVDRGAYQWVDKPPVGMVQ